MTGVDSQLLDRYELVRTLGKGAVGNVYLMRQVELDRLVAVKVLQIANMSPDQISRLRQEARALGSLSHKNVVAVHDVRTEGGQPFMVFEYVAGETLCQRIERPPLPSVAEVLDLVTQILDGLASAHSNGIVHRDLKPANIFLTETGCPKIGDFGLAKVSTAPTASVAGSIVGTPAYMSPEQCQGTAATFASDIYSMGIILYELSTGQRPFEGQTVAELMARQIRQTPPSMLRLRPDFPQQLETVIRQALEKDPGKRFESATSFRDALLSIRGQLPSLSSSASTERMERSDVSPPAKFSALKGLIVALIGSLVAFGMWVRKPETGDPPTPVLTPARESPIASPGSDASTAPRPDPVPGPGPTPRPGRKPLPAALQEAERQYRKALEKAPKLARAHAKFATFLQRNGSPEEAEKEFLIAEQLDPKDAATHQNLATLYRDRIRPEEAVEQFRRAKESAPADPYHASNYADQLFDMRRYTEAEVEYRNALRLDPSRSGPRAGLGGVLREQGKLEESIVEFRKALEQGKNDARAHTGYGLTLAELKQLDRASQEYDTAIELDPKDAWPHVCRGLLWASKNEMAKAEAEYSLAIELDPTYAQAYLNIGQIHRDQGKRRTALRELRLAIRYDPTDRTAHYNLGLLLEDLNDPAAAECYRRALEISPKYSDARLALAALLEKQAKNSNLAPAWSAQQAAGAPNTTEAGDFTSAWAALEPDRGSEWLELTYAEPIRATQVRIHETFNPGAVTAVLLVDARGKTIQKVPNTSPPSKKSPAWLEINFDQTAVPVKTVRIELDTAKVPDWNEIDAVELVGPRSRAWAESARASSFYEEESR